MSKQDITDVFNGVKTLADVTWTLIVGLGALVVLGNAVLDAMQHAQWDIKRIVLLAAVVPVVMVFASLTGRKLRDMGQSKPVAYRAPGRK
jgi:hypothetical protein